MFADLLRARFPSLSEDQLAKLAAHYDLMTRWNRTLNLTTVAGAAEAIERHYGESLFLAEFVGGGSVVDIGSGPGFPGIPIAIVRPEWQVTLVESHQRKAVFLKEATRQLPNVRVLSQRAEAVTERFAWAVSRAVSYDDLAKSLGKLAPRAALLTGAEAPPESLSFDWDSPIPVCGGRGFVRVGSKTAQ